MIGDGGADGGGANALDAQYARALDRLGSLITGRSRKDGHSWEWNHAMEVMQLCLEVSKTGRRAEKANDRPNTNPTLSLSPSTLKNITPADP
jgi:hypothetical protein